MNTTVTARVELELPLTITEGNIVRAAAARINAETWWLDYTERFLDGLRLAMNADAGATSWIVYRGGSHVALIKDGERILLAVEGRPEPLPEPDSRCFHCGDVVGNPAAHADCGVEEPPVAPNAALQAMIDGTYDQKPGDEPAAREAAERRNRVMGYLAAFTDREGRAYASAYAHWVDEVGPEAAIAYAANRGQGLTGSRKATIRRAIIAARG